MTVFVDTSALYAYLDRDDNNNARSIRSMKAMLGHEDLVTHNYVIVESTALAHRRLGSAAARALTEEIVPLLEIDWIDETVHRAASSAFLAAVRRRTSLVDWVSFEIMRRRGIRRAFAYDRDFAAQGFDLV
ncbi:MAG: type II toxin-antitoxin system VapC family toxin [Actinomycetota bacterium]